MPPKSYRKYPTDFTCVEILIGVIVFWMLIGWAVVHFFF